MLYRNIMFCLRETTYRVVLKQSWTPKQPQECFLNPPCECSNPGKDLQCEDCPHLEACLSQFKTSRVTRSKIKQRVTANPIKLTG